MDPDDTRLPRDEYLEFDTPILAEPRAGSAVMRQGCAGDRVTVIELHDGFAQIGVGRRAGYVRQDAVGISLPPTASAISVPLTARSASMKTDRPYTHTAIHPAHPGAMLVATGLTFFAWITVVLSQVVGFWLAAEYSCSDSLGGLDPSCNDEALRKLIAYLSFSVPGLFMALLMWATAYGLLLLTTMEANTRVTSFQTE